MYTLHPLDWSLNSIRIRLRELRSSSPKHIYSIHDFQAYMMLPCMGYLNVGYGVVPSYVAIGDIVGFQRTRSKKRIVHRIAQIAYDGTIIIKADNSDEEDCVSMSNIGFKLLWFKRLL
jgi:hypothetical protein